jgi:predicted DNA-binding transcriptional regulator AlpA
MPSLNEKPPKSHHLDAFAEGIAGHVANGDPDELLTTRYVAQLLHVSVATLEIWRSANNKNKKQFGPPSRKLSERIVRYRRADLVQWLRGRSQKWETSDERGGQHK